MDSELFELEFTKKLPEIKVFCAKDVAENMRKITKVINDKKKDWNVRAQAVSKLSKIFLTF